MGLAFLPSAYTKCPLCARRCARLCARTEGEVIASVFKPDLLCSFYSFLSDPSCPLSLVVRYWYGIKSQANEAMDVPEWYPGPGQAARGSLPLTPPAAVLSCLGCTLYKVPHPRGCCLHRGHVCYLKNTSFFKIFITAFLMLKTGCSHIGCIHLVIDGNQGTRSNKIRIMQLSQSLLTVVINN